jgi:hypothetical protein
MPSKREKPDSELPDPRSDRDTIFGYIADTFNGYEEQGSAEEVARIGVEVRRDWMESNTLPIDLKILRTALFYEFRADYFGGGIALVESSPGNFQMQNSNATEHPYLWDLVEAIRERLTHENPARVEG